MRREKLLLTAAIGKMTEKTQGWILICYHRLNAKEMARLRAKLVDCGSDIEVVKKRILRQYALQAAMVLPKEIPGSIALLTTNDLISSAKTLSEFRAGEISVLGGHGFGKPLGQSEIGELASLPTAAELQGMMIAMLTTPLSGLITTIGGVLGGINRCLSWQIGKEG